MPSPSLREQLKAIVREVIQEELENGNIDTRDHYEDEDNNRGKESGKGIENRGRVKDPAHDKRLKENRGQEDAA